MGLWKKAQEIWAHYEEERSTYICLGLGSSCLLVIHHVVSNLRKKLRILLC
jgi:hypothetical protein